MYILKPQKMLKFCNEIPDKINTKITGSESHYDVFDLEIIYYSDKSTTRRILNIRHKVV